MLTIFQLQLSVQIGSNGYQANWRRADLLLLKSFRLLNFSGPLYSFGARTGVQHRKIRFFESLLFSNRFL